MIEFFRTAIRWIIQIIHEVRVYSDHCHVIGCSTTQYKHKSSFKFQEMWLSHPELGTLIENNWKQPVCATKLYDIHIKLGRLKKALKEWNYSSFDNVHDRV